jgi:hypothetical protein
MHFSAFFFCHLLSVKARPSRSGKPAASKPDRMITELCFVRHLDVRAFSSLTGRKSADNRRKDKRGLPKTLFF